MNKPLKEIPSLKARYETVNQSGSQSGYICTSSFTFLETVPGPTCPPEAPAQAKKLKIVVVVAAALGPAAGVYSAA